ncbi:MAG: diaminopropionate ammonia-lyase [Planctomycetota bacterium]|jgi:diaminopropionate ammonia-lyase|nr:diaminopropionate ammonia-lyase [Planctomycetota bacterium]
MQEMELLLNPQRKPVGEGAKLADFTREESRRVRDYHRKFREYSPTPLVSLLNLAKSLGLANIFVKDESKRFGLNAFKVLGGSYALGRVLARHLRTPIEELDVEGIRNGAFADKTRGLAFATATDGNHGRGVAWTARQFHCPAHVFMPRGSAAVRADNIRACGADCRITDLNYDDTVRLAGRQAGENGWIMVQDTAWKDYEEIPRWVMQGYTTLAGEALEQLRERGAESPSHLFLQAGVGSFAGAALGFFAAVPAGKPPAAVIVEPRNADCHFRSLAAGDGEPRAVKGDLTTMMAGLACGEPSTLSWEIIRDYAAAALSVDDHLAANGMRILAAPLPGDPRVVSGESGAVGCGVLERICSGPEAGTLRKKLGLDSGSTVLLISTEGDTSPEIYRDVVWRGRFPAPETRA